MSCPTGNIPEDRIDPASKRGRHPQIAPALIGLSDYLISYINVIVVNIFINHLSLTFELGRVAQW
jgi:hypothetical protein